MLLYIGALVATTTNPTKLKDGFNFLMKEFDPVNALDPTTSTTNGSNTTTGQQQQHQQHRKSSTSSASSPLNTNSNSNINASRYQRRRNLDVNITKYSNEVIASMNNQQQPQDAIDPTISSPSSSSPTVIETSVLSPTISPDITVSQPAVVTFIEITPMMSIISEGTAKKQEITTITHEVGDEGGGGGVFEAIENNVLTPLFDAGVCAVYTYIHTILRYYSVYILYCSVLLYIVCILYYIVI